MTYQRQRNDNLKTVLGVEVVAVDISTTTTTTREHGAGRVPTPDELRAIREAYADAIGPLNRQTARMLVDALEGGIEPPVMLHAIEATGFAPRPSVHYLRAILRRYAASGIRTMADVERDERERHRAPRRDYTERDSRDNAAIYEGLFIDLDTPEGH